MEKIPNPKASSHLIFQRFLAGDVLVASAVACLPSELVKRSKTEH
jgi:hypothetical protein